ncbi:unnamed protein product [Phytophthora lilii]|uniref:Unnamed protein product n=1 Tax=Phytophthora lilii TaxID=2077276 RepID=A0A9W6X6A4_9STRA|nr:unnamed protein product [Phytophthora lilii]
MLGCGLGLGSGELLFDTSSGLRKRKGGHLALNKKTVVPVQDTETTQDATYKCLETGHVLAIIQELVASNRIQSERMAIVGAGLLKSKHSCVEEPTFKEQQVQDISVEEPKLKGGKKQCPGISPGSALPTAHRTTKIPKATQAPDGQEIKVLRSQARRSPAESSPGPTEPAISGRTFPGRLEPVVSGRVDSPGIRAQGHLSPSTRGLRCRPSEADHFPGS